MTSNAGLSKLERQIQAADPWPKPEALESEKTPSPTLPLDCFGAAKRYILSAGQGCNAPPDFIAAGLLAAIGALCGKWAMLKPDGINAEWTLSPALWLAIVCKPSTGKSPAFRPIKKQLRQIELAETKTHLARVESEYKAAQSNKADKETLEAIEAKRDIPPRLLATDATTEAMADIMNHAQRGLLLHSDELTGFLVNIERYQSSGRPFYLQAFDGGAYRIDRITRKAGEVDNTQLAIFGGIQPAKLPEITGGADDGLAGRFMYFWPDTHKSKSAPKGANHDALENALKRIQAARNIAETRVFALTPEARESYKDWYAGDRFTRPDYDGLLGSAIGKVDGLIYRLALALHILEYGFLGTDKTLTDTISQTIMDRAITLFEAYFIPQYFRIYETGKAPEHVRLALALLKAVKQKNMIRFNLREIRRTKAKFSGLNSFNGQNADLWQKAADHLIETRWIRKVDTSKAANYELNPAPV